MTIGQAALAIFKTRLAAVDSLEEWQYLVSLATNLTSFGDIVADVIPDGVFADIVNKIDSFSGCFESPNHDMTKVKKPAVYKLRKCKEQLIANGGDELAVSFVHLFQTSPFFATIDQKYKEVTASYVGQAGQQLRSLVEACEPVDGGSEDGSGT